MSPFLQESLPLYIRDVFKSGPDLMLTRAVISARVGRGSSRRGDGINILNSTGSIKSITQSRGVIRLRGGGIIGRGGGGIIC